MIDDFDHTHQQYDLGDQRNQGSQRIVLFLFIQLLLFLCDGILVSEVLDLDPVDIRFDLYHRDGILLNPYRDGKKNDFAEECE